jgi:hypothetical protein
MIGNTHDHYHIVEQIGASAKMPPTGALMFRFTP